MHEDARPIELTYLALQELNEQSLQEMEQPGPLVELHAHKPSEMQANKDYRGNGSFKAEILLLLSQYETETRTNQSEEILSSPTARQLCNRSCFLQHHAEEGIS